MSDALAYVALPPGASGPPVLIIHSWWGLTSSFTRYADRLAAGGFVVGCVDLYDGRTADTDQQAQELRRTRRSEPVYRVLQRSLKRLAAHTRASGVDPAVVGFSMGGHWAVWLAQHPPPTVAATVLYYAARAGDFTLTTSPVLAHFAGTDGFVRPSARRRMEHAASLHGLTYRCHDYPGTTHWFAESDQPAYDAAAAGAALDRTISFLADSQRG